MLGLFLKVFDDLVAPCLEGFAVDSGGGPGPAPHMSMLDSLECIRSGGAWDPKYNVEPKKAAVPSQRHEMELGTQRSISAMESQLTALETLLAGVERELVLQQVLRACSHWY